MVIKIRPEADRFLSKQIYRHYFYRSYHLFSLCPISFSFFHVFFVWIWILENDLICLQYYRTCYVLNILMLQSWSLLYFFWQYDVWFLFFISFMSVAFTYGGTARPKNKLKSPRPQRQLRFRQWVLHLPSTNDDIWFRNMWS